jgi:hypothetical protein
MKLLLFDAFHAHAPDSQASRTVTTFATLNTGMDLFTAPVNSDCLKPAVLSVATFIAAN